MTKDEALAVVITAAEDWAMEVSHRTAVVDRIELAVSILRGRQPAPAVASEGKPVTLRLGEGVTFTRSPGGGPMPGNG